MANDSDYMREYMRSRRMSGNLLQLLQDRKDARVASLRKTRNNETRVRLVNEIAQIEKDMKVVKNIKAKHS